MSSLVAKPRRSLVPLAFFGAFAVVIAANATMIYHAFRSAPALVSAKAYEQGKAYNRELAAAARQEALGWSAAVEFAPRAGDPAELVIRFVDRAGAPVEGLELAARLVRPIGRDPAIDITATETAPGRYVALVTLPAHGQWQLALVARRGDDEFTLARRVTAK